MVRCLPAALIALRLALGPMLLLDALDGQLSGWFAPGLLLALLSDIYDGVIARRVGVDTARLRLADSVIDAVFVGFAVAALWVVRRAALLPFLPWLVLVFGLEAIDAAVDVRRYGRVASYHSYSAKLTGVLYCLAGIGVAVNERGGVLLGVALAVAAYSHVEHLLITLTLERWTHDVKTLAAARRLARARP